MLKETDVRDYTINQEDRSITLHKPMTMTELCRRLIEDGHEDLVQLVTWEADEALKKLIRDGGWIESTHLQR